MSQPTIELISSRAAVCSDRETNLDVLIKITPPTLETPPERPTLNLGLVIDRSGSMSGRKIEYARQAACFAVQELTSTDRVSITIFDNEVQTLVPSTLVTDKAGIQDTIRRIHSGGSTALHQGWVNGAVQVSNHLDPSHLNRVVLLSDGLANRGETNPDRIAQDVHGLQQRGVSTTTLGVGADYDEDLLATMARSGDGNFYHIESPNDLPQIFGVELQGLLATVGRMVSLGVEPQANVTLSRVFNKLEKNQYGRFQLPNLVIDDPTYVVVRLKVPALASAAIPQPICGFRLAWDDPNQTQRQVIRTFLSLPVVSQTEWEQLPDNPRVTEQVALLLAAQARDEAIVQADRGNLMRVREIIQEQVTVLSAMPYESTAQEVVQFQDLERDLDMRNEKMMRKKMRYQSEDRFKGKSK